MKPIKFFACIALFVLATSALAETIQVPANKPAVTIDIPGTWKPEETDKGVSCESPDQVVTVFFEVVRSEKGMNALLDENINWLVKDQGVKIVDSTKSEKEFLVGGIKSSLIGYDANSKEYGPSKVGFIFTNIGNKLLVTTYWLTIKGFDKHEATLDRILGSVKPVK